MPSFPTMLPRIRIVRLERPHQNTLHLPPRPLPQHVRPCGAVSGVRRQKRRQRPDELGGAVRRGEDVDYVGLCSPTSLSSTCVCIRTGVCAERRSGRPTVPVPIHRAARARGRALRLALALLGGREQRREAERRAGGGAGARAPRAAGAVGIRGGGGGERRVRFVVMRVQVRRRRRGGQEPRSRRGRRVRVRRRGGRGAPVESPLPTLTYPTCPTVDWGAASAAPTPGTTDELPPVHLGRVEGGVGRAGEEPAGEGADEDDLLEDAFFVAFASCCSCSCSLSVLWVGRGGRSRRRSGSMLVVRMRRRQERHQRVEGARSVPARPTPTSPRRPVFVFTAS
ncbi:hypothetical protein B0H16DRAFT_1502517 [Mycena metata]|uniref:Uncharacterized protein n=1 Tax=Mycena metata TaxID=1033252 RepID=A0AAD7K4E3_9AGAR|nr:hypothetical protein B0H16DRAFT_1502517 [Mycena metata]